MGFIALTVVKIVEEFVEQEEVINIEGLLIFVLVRQMFKSRPVNLTAVIYLRVQVEKIFPLFLSFRGLVVLFLAKALVPEKVTMWA